MFSFFGLHVTDAPPPPLVVHDPVTRPGQQGIPHFGPDAGKLVQKL